MHEALKEDRGGLMSRPGVLVLALLGLAVVLAAIRYLPRYGSAGTPPFEEPERLMRLGRTHAAAGRDDLGVSVHDLRDWREGQLAFEAIAAWSPTTVAVRREGGEVDELEGAAVDAELLGVLRALPLLGRGFIAADTRPGAPPAILLGHACWQGLGGDPAMIGSSLEVDGEPATVLGVMPEGFAFPADREVWVPLRVDPDALPRGEGPLLSAVGRLAPGVTAAQARAELSGIAARLAREHPETNDGIGARVEPLFPEPGAGPMAD